MDGEGGDKKHPTSHDGDERRNDSAGDCVLSHVVRAALAACDDDAGRKGSN